jgi:HSP20 family protein
MTIVRRSSAPFGDLLSLRQAMDRLFEESFVNPRTWSWGDHQPVAMDVYATDEDLVLEANLPGVKPEEV